MGLDFYRKLLCLCSALLSAGSLAGSGYLTRVGPKPLRFEAVVPRLDPAKALPPLTMEEPEPVPAQSITPEFGPQPPPASPLPTVDEFWAMPPPDEPPSTEGNAATPATPATPAPAGPKMVSPDELLQFFAPVKRREGIISVPVEFTPPAPRPASGGSRATYIVK